MFEGIYLTPNHEQLDLQRDLNQIFWQSVSIYTDKL